MAKIAHQANSETTQVTGTRTMYVKALKHIRGNVHSNAHTVLDYGAGMGIGAKDMRNHNPELLIHTL